MAFPVSMRATKRGRFPVASKDARTVDGIVFDSAKEAKRYAELVLLERAGLISGLVRQRELFANILNEKFCKLTVDFRYYDHGLSKEIFEEVKSSGTKRDAAYRLRKKAVEIANCIKITELIR